MSIGAAGRVLLDAVLAGALVLLSGCMHKEAHSIAGPTRTSSEASADPQSLEPPSVPPPGEVDSALQAAQRAEAAGDAAGAIEFYEHVTMMPDASSVQMAEAHLALAMLSADPNAPQRDVEQARAHLRQMLQLEPDHPRARDASLLLALLDEIGTLQSRTAELTAQSDTIRSSVTELIAKLDEKERELQKVKQVLLQNKP